MPFETSIPGRLFAAYRQAFVGLPAPVWWLSVVIFVNRCGTMVIPFLALYMTQELEHPVTAAGFVLGAYGTGHLVGGALGGWLSDKVGPLPVQVASLIISGIGFLALEPLRSVSSLAIVVFVAATAAEGFRPANYAALAAYAPSGLQARAVALNRLAVNLGWGVAPVVGGVLASFDYRWLFRVDGATCLMAAVLMGFLISSNRLPKEPSRGVAEALSSTREVSSSESGAEEAKPSEASPGMETATSAGLSIDRHPLQDGLFLAFLGVAVIMACMFFQAWGPFPVYLAEIYGISEARYGALMAVNAVLILAFEMVITHRVERNDPLAIMGFGAFVMALGFAILPLGHGWAFAAVSVAIWTLGEILLLPAVGGWVAERASVAHRGKYMGLYTMSWGVAFMIAPAAGTWVYQHLSPDAVWWMVGVLGIVSWALCELLRRYGVNRPVGSPGG